MTELGPRLEQLLVLLGPWVVAAVTFLETAFITGLVVPAGPTIVAACVLVVQDYFGLWTVVLATALGGALGDTCGFWVGRTGGRRLIRGPGRIREMARRQEARSAALFHRHAILSVTGARLVSFVRTLMPWVAGMSPIPYVRFLLYDLLGVALWAAAYVALGMAAARGWDLLGTAVGTRWAVLVLAVVLVAWMVLRVRRARRAAAAPGEGTGP